MADYLGSHMLQTDYTLLKLNILFRDNKYNDYQDISQYLLFTKDKSAYPSLNITKSEIAFFKKVDIKLIKFSLHYNINSFLMLLIPWQYILVAFY